MENPKNIDLLFNIESAIISVYKEHPQMRDRDAIKGLNALIDTYRAKITKRPLTPPQLGEFDGLIYEYVSGGLGLTTKLKQELGDSPPVRKRFSRALQEPTEEEKILAALRKIEKSAKRWNERNGERGYLNFIESSIPS